MGGRVEQVEVDERYMSKVDGMDVYMDEKKIGCMILEVGEWMG